jgi:Na+/melibiose symporter-like transporter
MTNNTQSLILWRQVLSLAAVQGSITLCWIIYHLYLGKLLAQLGFPPGLVTTILTIDIIITAVMEPISGELSDRANRWMGTQFPLIALGTIAASVLFIAIPTATAFGVGALRPLLPCAVIAWALAMALFRTPAMTLLRQYATPQELPQAMSVLTLIGGTIGAISPFFHQAILNLGEGVAFTLGSLVLLGATWALRACHAATGAPISPQNPQSLDLTPDLPKENGWTLYTIGGLGFVIAMSFAMAGGSRFVMATVSKAIAGWTDRVALVMAGISLAVAIGALLAGWLSARWGNLRCMLVGAIAIIPSVLAIGGLPRSGLQLAAIWVFLPILILAYSVVLNGAIPFVMSLVAQTKTGLGIGTYFGAMAAASGVMNSQLPPTDQLSPLASSTLSAIAFLGLAALLGYCRSMQRKVS